MIIFINGSINSGKSTVSKLLAEKLGNTAVVEIDSLRAFVEWMPLDQTIPLNLANAVSVITNFANNNLGVIVPYPLSEKNYLYMMENLKGLTTPIYVFTLAPKLEKVLTNRGTRELNEQEIERIKYHYSIGIHSPTFGDIIDNSEQSPEETVALILNKIKK